MQIFKKANLETECDACGKPFSVSTGGVCERCRRILCNEHLHGSILRRVAMGFGAPMLCVRCRLEATPSRP